MNLIETVKKSNFSHRYESFGGIISSEEPPFLAHVDKNFMLSLGLPESPLWESNDSLLSAPLEVHFAVTNQCSAGCDACYTNSLPKDPHKLSSKKFKEAIDILSNMKVFHLAMGGGEALEREDFFELAAYVREKGITPNLTTNGLHITTEIARKCKLFGQVNISIDGVGEAYRSVRGYNGFEKALKALRILKEEGIRVGINCVVTRSNFDFLDELAQFAQKEKVYDIEFLRIKPTGRGREQYDKMKLTDSQNKKLFSKLKRIAQKTKVRLKADCSFMPMIAYHKPNKKLMEQFSVYGCEAGNVLLGVNSAGKFAGCSFLSGEESLFDLKELWKESPHLKECREVEMRLPEPCASCHYLSLCKGGCRAVVLHHSSDIIPDPECPFVIDWKEK